MAATLTLDYRPADFPLAFKTIEDALAQAGTATMQDAAALVKAKGRANIAGAGFGTSWQNALRADVYPQGRTALDASVWVHHNIPYSEVFETGATIRGKPLLWLPLRSTPKTIAGRKTTPRNWAQSLGALFTINRAGKPPLLGGPLPGGGSGPLFIGIDAVSISKKFNILGIVADVQAQVPSLYASHLKAV